MDSYFAYHSKENADPFDVAGGYGFTQSAKLQRVRTGDIVYIIQKLSGWNHFELCGKFKITGRYENPNDEKGRHYRLRLEDLSELEEPVRIDEDAWSSLLPEHPSNNNWSNFKKHFCQQGESLQRQLTSEVIDVIESHLPDKTSNDISNDIEAICTNNDLSKTERESLITARLGQGKFKSNVKNVWGAEKCFVTLCDISELLIASHIKPWKSCSDSTERLDGANGLLLCSHIDKLFDKYLITFKERQSRYELVMAPKLQKSDLRGLGVTEGLSLNLTNLSLAEISRFRQYMAHHNEVFDNKNK